MKKSLLTLLTTILLGASLFSFGQGQVPATVPEPSEHVRLVQFTLFYPLGTNGIESYRITNRISLNLIAGVTGGVLGAEFGGILNVTNGWVEGGQFAGFGNIVRQQVQGAQFAGFGNLSGGSVRGVQGAGFMNVNRGSVRGVQGAGFMNVNGGRTTGPQLAGFMNINGGSYQGVQVAGFMNINGGEAMEGAPEHNGPQVAGFANVNGGNLKGVQVAGFLNVAPEVEGAQIGGFLNIARKVKGVQVGFINLAEDIDGVPIGFLSIVKNGTRAVTFFANEVMLSNIGVKVGSRRIYNILSAGYNPGAGLYRYSFGWGIGHHGTFGERVYLDTDLMVQNLHESRFRSDLSMLTSVRVLPGFRLGNVFSLYAGPTFNYFISDYADGSELGRRPVYTREPGPARNTYRRAWFGVTGGVQVNF
jgi:hypothetical protein